MKSNIENFIDYPNIQSTDDYFKSSKNTLRKLIDEQSLHEHRALKCIIEIGKTLSELQDYKKRIKSSKADELWTDLLNEVELSPSTVTKYIKISTHPILSDKRFIGRIPVSVFSLYELTKLEPVTLQLLIESNEISATSGRSVIESLSKPVVTSKKSSSKQVPLMSLSIPEKDWIKNYKNFEPELLNLLKKLGISYEFSFALNSLDKSEVTRMKKVQKFVFQQSKVFFNQTVKNYIDQQCRHKNLCPPQTPFKKKMKLLKFGVDEVTTEGCIDISEVSVRLIDLGLVDQMEWNKRYMDWMDQGLTKFRSKLPESTHDLTHEDSSYAIDEFFTPVKKRKDFSGFKV